MNKLLCQEDENWICTVSANRGFSGRIDLLPALDLTLNIKATHKSIIS